MAPVLAEIAVGDPPEAWRAAGFTVDDDGVVRIGSVAISLVGRDEGKRILSWSFAGLADEPGDLDGLPTPPARLPSGPAGDHPNGCVQIDHIVVLTPDLERTQRALGSIGLEPRATRETDTYGMPMRQTFFRSGEVIIEVIGPSDPDDSSDGPAGFFGLAHTVADLDATAALLGEHLGRVKDAVQPGRRIATLRHRDVGVSVATAFMSAEPA